MRIGEWPGRVLTLVLAGLATLSILASLEAASDLTSSGSGSRPLAEASEGAAGSIGGAPSRPSAAPAPESAPSPGAADAPSGEAAVTQQVSHDAGEVARWLEALTYAVLALAGFAAAGLIVLLRVSGALARIADRA